jgi:hypothetical protein
VQMAAGVARSEGGRGPEPFRDLGPQRGFGGLEVREDIESVFVLRADLHSGRGQRNVRVELAAEQPPHFRDGGGFVHPDTGEIRLAVRGARHRGGEVRFAVACAGRSGSREIQPLRLDGCRKEHEQEEQPSLLQSQILPDLNVSLAGQGGANRYRVSCVRMEHPKDPKRR